MDIYLKVSDDCGNIIEIPLETDKSVSLPTLSSQFIGATGLKYQGPNGFWRGLRLEFNHIIPPRDLKNWETILYRVVQNKENKRKIDDIDDNIKYVKKPLPKKCCDLIVLGLNSITSNQSLKKVFLQYGDVVLAEVKRDKFGKSKGFGFIRFSEYESQLKVVLKKFNIDGKWCTVKLPDSKGGNAAISSSKVFIGGVDSSLTSSDLKEFFESQFDTKVVDVFFVPSKNYAFVTFMDLDIPHSLYGESFDIKGKNIFCRPADPISDNNLTTLNSANKSVGGSHNLSPNNTPLSEKTTIHDDNNQSTSEDLQFKGLNLCDNLKFSRLLKKSKSKKHHTLTAPANVISKKSCNENLQSPSLLNFPKKNMIPNLFNRLLSNDDELKDENDAHQICGKKSKIENFNINKKVCSSQESDHCSHLDDESTCSKCFLNISNILSEEFTSNPSTSESYPAPLDQSLNNKIPIYQQKSPNYSIPVEESFSSVLSLSEVHKCQPDLQQEIPCNNNLNNESLTPNCSTKMFDHALDVYALMTLNLGRTEESLENLLCPLKSCDRFSQEFYRYDGHSFKFHQDRAPSPDTTTPLTTDFLHKICKNDNYSKNKSSTGLNKDFSRSHSPLTPCQNTHFTLNSGRRIKNENSDKTLGYGFDEISENLNNNLLSVRLSGSSSGLNQKLTSIIPNLPTRCKRKKGLYHKIQHSRSTSCENFNKLPLKELDDKISISESNVNRHNFQHKTFIKTITNNPLTRNTKNKYFRCLSCDALKKRAMLMTAKTIVNNHEYDTD